MAMADGGAGPGTSGVAAANAYEPVPAGSLRYFALLFSGSPNRPLAEAVYAFEAELRRIVSVASHEAAHARLQWWRGEIDRLLAGRASHPLGRALLPLREHPDADLALLHEMLVAADLDLARMTYLSWQELDAYLFRCTGSAQTIISAVLCAGRGLSTAERRFARRLGAAVRQSEMLHGFEQDMAQGRFYAPTEALQAAGIDPEAFRSDKRSAAASTFLADWRDRVRNELEDLSTVLVSTEHRSDQRHGLVLAALHNRWLDASPDITGYPAPSRPFGPLSRLWTAWRTALQSR